MSEEKAEHDILLKELKLFFKRRRTVRYLIVLCAHDSIFRDARTSKRVQHVVSGYREPAESDLKWLRRAVEIANHIKAFGEGAVTTKPEQEHGS